MRKNQDDKQGIQDLFAEIDDFPSISQCPKTRQITSAFPPAASIFALADSEKAAALTVRFFSRDPLPRTLIPSPIFLTRPAFFQRFRIHGGAVLKCVESRHVDSGITGPQSY